VLDEEEKQIDKTRKVLSAARAAMFFPSSTGASFNEALAMARKGGHGSSPSGASYLWPGGLSTLPPLVPEGKDTRGKGGVKDKTSAV